MTLRVLFSGSRDWPAAWREMISNVVNTLPPGTIVRHGGCPTGVDVIVDERARARGDLDVKVYVACWASEGKSAGPKRNQYMVDLGNDYGFFFSLNRSPGTEGCYEMAKAAGIQCAMHRVELVLE